MNVEPDLFVTASENLEPLAARMRPKSLAEVIGQAHLSVSYTHLTLPTMELV